MGATFNESRAAWMRVLIVDDEPLARCSIAALLRGDPECASVRECATGEAAVNEIRAAKPDLVFLDVEMPEIDGFDVLELLGCDLPAATIFVTAHESYAVRAFDTGALDYLLKPFDDARFGRAVERAKRRIIAARAAAPQPATLAVKLGNSVSFVRIGDIDWLEAADYYTRLHVGSKSYLVRRSMAEFESELDPAFCRVHRSAIVRLERVRGVVVDSDGGSEVLLADGTRLPLSRSYRKQFHARLG